jgi:hypothetical protein
VPISIFLPTVVLNPPAKPAPVVVQQPAPPPVVVQQPAPPPPAPPAPPQGSAAIATAGSGAGSATPPVAPVAPVKPDDSTKHASSHANVVATAPVVSHRDHESSTADSNTMGMLRLQLEDGDFATVTIQGQKRTAPGDKFRLLPGPYTAHVKDPKEGTAFKCSLTVEPGMTSTVNISLKDESCDQDDR